MDEQKRSSAVQFNKTLEMPGMPSKNERVELDMKIMKYRRMASRITDDEFLKRIAEQISELEKKRREIDE